MFATLGTESTPTRQKNVRASAFSGVNIATHPHPGAQLPPPQYPNPPPPPWWFVLYQGGSTPPAQPPPPSHQAIPNPPSHHLTSICLSPLEKNTTCPVVNRSLQAAGKYTHVLKQMEAYVTGAASLARRLGAAAKPCSGRSRRPASHYRRLELAPCEPRVRRGVGFARKGSGQKGGGGKPRPPKIPLKTSPPRDTHFSWAKKVMFKTAKNGIMGTPAGGGGVPKRKWVGFYRVVRKVGITLLQKRERHLEHPTCPTEEKQDLDASGSGRFPHESKENGTLTLQRAQASRRRSRSSSREVRIRVPDFFFSV